MRRRMLYTIAVAIFFLSLNHTPAYAQADETRKVELGGHFTVLRDRNSDQTEPGFGGRIGYNVHQNVTVEAELNLLPEGEDFRGGNKVQGLFGVKAGKRFEKVGIFAKLRPGFFHLTEGEIRLRQDTVCIATFPPPAGCVETSGKTFFNVDLGGVLEVYPSPRTIIRLDVGDTIIRIGDQTLGGFTFPGRTEHNLQGSIGLGFRF